jgi:hypothetical protein
MSFNIEMRPGDSPLFDLPGRAPRQVRTADKASSWHNGYADFILPAIGGFWNNGGTGGHSAVIAFNVKLDVAIVVLYNRQDVSPWQPRRPRFTDQVYAAVVKLLTGELPAALAR